MTALIWMGALVSMLGVAGLMYCVLRALRARRSAAANAGTDTGADDALRLELQRVVVINMAALGVSAIGLMMVVAGILLS